MCICSWFFVLYLDIDTPPLSMMETNARTIPIDYQPSPWNGMLNESKLEMVG